VSFDQDPRDLVALMHARPVPLTGQVAIDRDDVSAILDQMRYRLPEAIKGLRWYRQQRLDAGETVSATSTIWYLALG
jgi:hypothetical protein